MGERGGNILWPAEAIWEAVYPLLPTFSVEVLPQIDSTNSELMRRARAGQLDPVLLVAERQTAGRGRLGRSWNSGVDTTGEGAKNFAAGPPQGEMAPSGGSAAHAVASVGATYIPALTFSLGMPLAPQDWSGLSLAVGLSVVESLHPALQLKWPNDVWFQDRKLAGILIETVNVGELRYAVIGVGVNILLPDQQGLRTAPAALHELRADVDAPTALGLVAPNLVRDIQRFAEQGFAPLRTAYHARDLLYGRELVCSDGVVGIARGVDAMGALLLHTDAGLKKITSAEVSVRPVPPPSAEMP